MSEIKDWRKQSTPTDNYNDEERRFLEEMEMRRNDLWEQSQPKKKDASVIGRGIVGGIVAGPAGAIVGALSAIDKNRKNNK